MEIAQLPEERVVIFRLERAGARLDLVAELLGSPAQLLVVGADGRVREALRRVAGAGRRRLAPGDPYEPPPVGSRRSPAARDLLRQVEAGRAEPRIYRPAELPAGAAGAASGAPLSAPCLAMLRLPHLEPEPGRPIPGVAVEPFESPSAAVEAFHASPAHRLARRAAPLRARLLKARERLVRRLSALAGDRANLERAADARRLGDLLAAQRSLLRKGQREVKLVDLFDPAAPTVTVALDPALDPQGNIDACYARARKARRGLEAVASRQAATESELAYLDQALYALEAAEEPADLEALEAELVEQGILLRPGPAPARERPAGRPAGVQAPPLRRFRSSDGFEIVAGKSNVGNDYVSTRLARPDDLWLHAEGYPGAHVLVRRRSTREAIPERTVLEAAALAAFYSWARGATRVAVHVATASSVRKPRGARPGLVTLTGGHRTVVVTPDPDLPARLAAAASPPAADPPASGPSHPGPPPAAPSASGPVRPGPPRRPD